MRTTITIEDNILDKAKSVAASLHTSFRKVINEALRAGLKKIEAPARRIPYRTKPHEMGVKQGMNLDNIQELLAQVEQEDFR